MKLSNERHVIGSENVKLRFVLFLPCGIVVDKHVSLLFAPCLLNVCDSLLLYISKSNLFLCYGWLTISIVEVTNDATVLFLLGNSERYRWSPRCLNLQCADCEIHELNFYCSSFLEIILLIVQINSQCDPVFILLSTYKTIKTYSCFNNNLHNFLRILHVC